MKSDLDKLLLLLDSFGVTYGKEIDERNQVTTVKMEAKEHEKVDGYTGFFTEFQFNWTGKFISMGVWE